MRILCLILLCIAVNCPARDAYVLLSGGGTPLSNNYSQYLQAEALSAWLQRSYPADSVWVFFGCGNQPGQPSVLADVHRRTAHGNLALDSWLPGALPHNRPATREVFLRALKEEILPAVHAGGTLYLLVGDHGSLAKSAPKESVITLWQLQRGDGHRSWFTNPTEELGVTELRDVLRAGLGQGRVVFCMTQCHSGGFHFLGGPRAVAVPASWFAGPVPAWAQGDAAAPLAVAGFTSTDEPSIAAGCDPDPDPDVWAGYERYFPENLLGCDLISGQTRAAPQASFASAHAAAVRVDQTIDKPRSTSEQYLALWAETLERLAGEPTLVPATRAQVQLYQQSVDRGLADGNAGPGFQACRAGWSQEVARLAAQAPAVADALRQGRRADLETLHPPGHQRSGNRAERRRLWQEVLRPAWKEAVQRGEVGLPDGVVAFERHLLALEDQHREFMFPDGSGNALLNEIYWQSGYAVPDQTVPAHAEEVARWAAERSAQIHAWAEGASDPAVRAAAGILATSSAAGRHMPRVLRAETAAERTLFYRRIAAAWVFLWNTHDTAALEELRRLQALESTPLPPVAR